MMLDEKKARQENDTVKGSELCVKIVSSFLIIYTENWLINPRILVMILAASRFWWGWFFETQRMAECIGEA